MDPNCKYLSGKFASQSNTSARAILSEGWTKWSAYSAAVGSATVPLNYSPVVGGLPASEKRVKLRISYRDLPRGNVKRPGNSQFTNPYNLGWFDISKQELKTIITKENDAVFKKLALATLKDSVRGEMHGWNTKDWKGGKLTARWFRQDGHLAFYYLEGYAQLFRDDTGLSYNPKIFGFVGFDHSKQDFRDLQLVAVGQRAGKGPSNGRDSDANAAPMGVAIRMQLPGH